MGQFSPVVTSAGEKLALTSHRSDQWQEVPDHMQNQARPKFYVNFNLTPPTLPADSIKGLAGDVDLMIAMGPKRRAVLGPIEKVDGKTAEIRGLDDCRIRVKRTGDDKFRVDYIGHGWKLLDQAKFYNGNGTEMSPNSWSGGGHVNNGQYHREYRMGMSDGGKVVIDLWADTKVVPGKFEVARVALPGARISNRVELTIESKPIDDAEAIEEIGMGDNDFDKLNVVILEDAS